jgi:hypothetical protein
MFAKAVNTFPAIFNSATRGANLAKAVDWWAKRNRFLDAARGSVAVSARRRHQTGCWNATLGHSVAQSSV